MKYTRRNVITYGEEIFRKKVISISANQLKPWNRNKSQSKITKCTIYDLQRILLYRLHNVLQILQFNQVIGLDKSLMLGN